MNPEQGNFPDLKKEKIETSYSFSRITELLAEHKLSHGSPEGLNERISSAMKIPEIREAFNIATLPLASAFS